jgi:hypothetical protein
VQRLSHLRILATFVSPLLQPSFDGLSAIPHMTAYPIAGWPVALVPPAVQSVNGDAQHFRDIRQRHQLVTGLQRHDHLLSWRQLVNPGHWRGRSIQPCLRPDRLAAVHSPTCVSPNMEDLSSTKPLSHDAATCGREDRHRTGGAVILVWVGIMLVRMARDTLRPLRPEQARCPEGVNG